MVNFFNYFYLFKKKICTQYKNVVWIGIKSRSHIIYCYVVFEMTDSNVLWVGIKNRTTYIQQLLITKE